MPTRRRLPAQEHHQKTIPGQAPPAPVTRKLVDAAGLTWQLREAGPELAGQRASLVLLHPSPRSSVMYEPWMAQLGRQRHVVAVDTPGYGGSDPLPRPPSHLGDYVGPLRTLLLQVLPEGPFLIYGSATGAQLGIAYANQFPGDVAHLVLDNAAHFDDDERRAILAHYFPDLTPRADGSHLMALWRMCAQMGEYFPWFEANESHRISSVRPTPPQLQMMFSEFIAAGPTWALAYRCAFEHERAANVQRLSVPTSLLRWEGSILLRHIDRLLQHPLPACVRALNMPADQLERYRAMGHHFDELP